MPEILPLTWIVGIAALVVGILAGHFGWGRRWPTSRSRVHPDYLAGLDYLITEQPDRALDMFLRLMDASADTLETHFSLGSLYRRRGEVERAIRIHQNLLSRDALAPEHREQALFALAQDYLRAGLLDRAEVLLQRVSEVARLRAAALDALRGVYERQHEWQQALGVYRLQMRIKAAPPRMVAAHYLCELAALAMEREDAVTARRLLRDARAEVSNLPRAAVLRSRLAERQGDLGLAVGLLRRVLEDAPKLMDEELAHVLRLVGTGERERVLEELARQAQAQGLDASRRFVFTALSAGVADAPPLAPYIDRVFADDPMLRSLSRSMAPQIATLLVHAGKYRCAECGFAARNFYWQCPACHAWDSFEPHAIVKLG